MKRENLLTWAEIIDAWRVVPRTLLVAYGYLVWYVVNWYMGLADPTTAQTILVTTISGLSTAIIGLYQSSGRDWISYNRESIWKWKEQEMKKKSE